MVTEAKISAVNELTTELKSHLAFFVTEYKGLKVADLVELRKSLRSVSSSYRVVKNTLFRRALANAGMEVAAEYFQGPVAVAFVNGDVVMAVKTLVDFNKKNPNLKLKAGVVEGKIIGQEEIQTLATLPGRQMLLTMVVQAVVAPLSKFIFTLRGPINKLLWVLNALKAKKQEVS